MATADELREQVRSKYAEPARAGDYQAGLEAAGFEQVSVQLTHEVADELHDAIVEAVKTTHPGARGLPVVRPAANGAGC